MRVIGFLQIVLFAFFTTGCYFNKAVVDPWSYAPQSQYCPWQPDMQASLLACKEAVAPFLECDDSYLFSLSEVLDIALLNSPQTQQTWAQARQAAAQYGQSQSYVFPTVNLQYSYQRFRFSYLASQVGQDTQTAQNVLFTTTQSQWGPQSQLTYTILDFGQKRYTSEAARFALYYADYTHNRAIQTLIETVTTDYYNYLYQKKLLEADEADLVNAKETLTAAEVGLRSGIKNISDVLQAKSQVLLAEIQLSEQHKFVNDSYAVLLQDMGLASDSKVFTQHLPFVDPSFVKLEPLDCYLDIAMQSRPDLLAARANLVSSEMSLKSAKRLWMPVVNYSLDFGKTYFSGGFQDKYDYTSLISVSMPLFTGFSIRNKVKFAKAQVEESKAILKQSELEMVKDVKTAHYDVYIAYEVLKSSIQLLKTAKEQYEVAMAQYKAGVNTILDVISAQTNLFDARAKQAKGTEQWFISFANLAYSTGIMAHSIKENL